MSQFILSIDQGTTSSRAILFNAEGRASFSAQRECIPYFPKDGWVEHDPEEIWRSTTTVLAEALAWASKNHATIVAMGIANQRETTLVWDRSSGKPIYNAIVWQDRRTTEMCHQLRQQGHEPDINARTGLLLDPYFSATKVRWILDHVKGARALAEKGRLAFGTVDSFLLWQLTGGKVHATDATNASRTMLFNIHQQDWDAELLDMFEIPALMLPKVLDSADNFGTTDAAVTGATLSIGGVAGDQHAALIGQGCFQQGMVKSTYGTGCFMMLNTGKQPLTSRHRLLTTLAYRLGGETTYALEGAIFMAGATIQWLRDNLGIIASAAETETLASSLDSNHGVYLVPAFTGLGAPYWDPRARAAIFGMTRDTDRAHLARAALEAVCYQSNDLLEAMRADGIELRGMRVDGGMVCNNWLCQFLADVLNIHVERPTETETTALGAAYLAGLQAGVYGSLDDVAAYWQAERQFPPAMPTQQRTTLLQAWKGAVARITSCDPVASFSR